MRVVLSVGGWREELPACLSRLFDSPTDKRIKITASWYHDPGRSGLPPYLNIELPQQGSTPQHIDHYWLSFNLDNGAVINLTSFFKVDDATTQIREVPISTLCDESKRNQLPPAPVGTIESLNPAVLVD